MPTIRTLLDRYGQPPPEVACDWAWQIRDCLDNRAAATDEPTHTCLLEERAWTDLEVSETGELVCGQLDSRTAQAALADLRQWSGGSYDCPTAAGDLTRPAGDSVDAKPIGQVIRGRRQSTSWLGARWPVVWGGLGLTGVCLVLCLWFADNAATDGANLASGFPIANDAARNDAAINDALNGKPLSGAAPDSEPSLESVVLEALPTIEPPAAAALDPSDQATPSTGHALGNLTPQPGLVAPASPIATVAPSTSATEAAQPEARASAAAGAAHDNALDDVKQTLKQAEAEAVVPANRSRDSGRIVQDTHGDPWVLTRDTMRYRVNLSPKLQFNDRESQWTLALEPVEGLMVEPRRPVTLSPRGLAIWRIYDPDAKPPRALLMIRAVHHGRDGQLELVFCGGAEDMPGMSVPLAQRWLAPLTVRVQAQALELQGGLARLSTSVITRDQVPAVMQRKQAMQAQMLTCARLGVIMPEVNRLAELVDGQVTMHAALRPKPNEAPIATWGQVP